MVQYILYFIDMTGPRHYRHSIQNFGIEIVTNNNQETCLLSNLPTKYLQYRSAEIIVFF